MAPAEKRPKIMTSEVEEQAQEQAQGLNIHADHRIAWLFAADDAFVEIKVKGEKFRVHKGILCRHSEYFNTCLNKPFKEASECAVSFDDIEPRYMAYYIGVAYSFSTIVPHAAPPKASPGLEAAAAQRTSLRDFIEVLKLCDRFLSAEMSKFTMECVRASIGERYRALFRSSSADEALQKLLMREFADAYEALETTSEEQKALAALIDNYFCEGIDYKVWDREMGELMDRSRFVAMVSRGFARKLSEVETAKTKNKLKRKELAGP